MMQCALCPTNDKKQQFFFYVVRGITLCEDCYEREVVEPVKALVEKRQV